MPHSVNKFFKSMQCSQLHHINSGFYTTLLYSVYPHLVPTSVHPCPFLPYISYNYIHRSLVYEAEELTQQQCFGGSLTHFDKDTDESFQELSLG